MCETIRKGLRESPPALAQPLAEKFAHSGHMRRQLINGSQPDIKTGEARRKEGMPLSSMPQVVCCRAVVYQGKNRALPVSTEGPLSARAKRMKYEIGEEGREGIKKRIHCLTHCRTARTRLSPLWLPNRNAFRNRCAVR